MNGRPESDETPQAPEFEPDRDIVIEEIRKDDRRGIETKDQ